MPTFLTRDIDFHSDDPQLVDVGRGWDDRPFRESGSTNRGSTINGTMVQTIG